MISILIPTRGRPEGLRSAVEALLLLASHPPQVEILLRSDDDQPPMTDVILPALVGCPFPIPIELRGPRGAGYRSVYQMYNDLAAASHGDWMISWNDDIDMLTPGWDEIIHKKPAHTVQFLRRDIAPEADWSVPCTHRSVYQAMGHLSLAVHADNWMEWVARGAGVGFPCNDVVFHHHRLNDQTSYDRDHGGYDMEGFKTPEMVVLRAEAIERVMAAAPK